MKTELINENCVRCRIDADELFEVYNIDIDLSMQEVTEAVLENGASIARDAFASNNIMLTSGIVKIGITSMSDSEMEFEIVKDIPTDDNGDVVYDADTDFNAPARNLELPSDFTNFFTDFLNRLSAMSQNNPQPSSNIDADSPIILEFKSLDEVIHFASIAPVLKNTEATLYKMNNKYFLYAEAPERILLAASEYEITESVMDPLYLFEHGEVITKNAYEVLKSLA